MAVKAPYGVLVARWGWAFLGSSAAGPFEKKLPTETLSPSRTKVGEPTVSLLCAPCHKAGKIKKLAEETAKFIDGVSHCTECWSAYGDRLVKLERGRYTLKPESST